MFSFHRPKVYRSSTGCCICKAKSSSSRFTDSKKYEDDFLECFKLSTPRQGEICNACVLLVKRWKKLPAGSDRNWQHSDDYGQRRLETLLTCALDVTLAFFDVYRRLHKIPCFVTADVPGRQIPMQFCLGVLMGVLGRRCHTAEVVDARAGPGMKSMTKFKSKNKKSISSSSVETIEKIKKKKRFEREYSPASDKSDEDNDDNVEDFLNEDGPSGPSSCTGSPGGSDCEPEVVVEKSRRQKGLAKRFDSNRITDFVDFDYWKRETICCGTIYRGLNNEIMLDSRLYKPCNSRLEKCKREISEQASKLKAGQPMEIEGVATTKAYSDSSSDSGYDESSNHAEKVFCPEC